MNLHKINVSSQEIIGIATRRLFVHTICIGYLFIYFCFLKGALDIYWHSNIIYLEYQMLYKYLLKCNIYMFNLIFTPVYEFTTMPSPSTVLRFQLSARQTQEMQIQTRILERRERGEIGERGEKHNTPTTQFCIEVLAFCDFNFDHPNPFTTTKCENPSLSSEIIYLNTGCWFLTSSRAFSWWILGWFWNLRRIIIYRWWRMLIIRRVCLWCNMALLLASINTKYVALHWARGFKGSIFHLQFWFYVLLKASSFFFSFLYVCVCGNRLWLIVSVCC